MSEKRFQQLMDNVTNFAIVFKNTDGIIQEWNAGAETIMGWKREEVVGQSIQIIYTPEDRANQISPAEMKIAAEEGKAEDERWHLKKDGSIYYASGLLHPLFEEGELTGYVKIIRDLTERVALEAALEDARNSTELTVEERTARIAVANKDMAQEVDKRERDRILRAALMRRVMITQEEERKRISRDLHDHLGQKLTALRLRIEVLKSSAAANPELGNQIMGVEELARDIDSEVDFLAWELRPASIDELGLEIALDNFIREFSKHFDIEVEFNLKRRAEKRLNSVAEINLYRIAQEAMNNVIKYAEASMIRVTLAEAGQKVELVVEDDGVGFDPAENTNKAKGLGLVGMGERAAILEGELTIESKEGQGTRIYACIPAIYQDGESLPL